MKYVGLDDREYNINFEKYKKGRGEVSSGHQRARQIIAECFMGNKIYEEVLLPGTEGRLYVDFFLPSREIIIEVDGIQHREYNKFFHKNLAGFVKSQVRDVVKQQWCDNNNILLIRLKAEDKDEEWRQQITSRETS